MNDNARTNEDATPQQIADLAPIALTYPGSDVVNVRMQTEHLYALEQDLTEQRGVPADRVAERFEALHRCPPLPLDTWLATVTDAYNQTITAQRENPT